MYSWTQNISKPLPKLWNLTLEPLSLEFNDLQKNHNHFQTGGQNLEIWPLAAKPGNERFVKGSLMKMISSRPLAKTWKSGYAAGKFGNQECDEGSPYENDNFQAVGPNQEIWLWSHNTWTWRICKRICLRKHWLPSIRKSLYNPFVFRHGGFRPRFGYFG